MKVAQIINSYLIYLASFCLILVSCQNASYVTPAPGEFSSSLNTKKAENYGSFNRDGTLLVFTSDRKPSQKEILLYDLARLQLIPLPGLNQANSLQDQPDISGDGRYIVYVSEQFGKPDIMIYDRQSFSSKNITKNLLGEVRHPRISGNGRFVVFEHNRQGQWDLQIYDQGIETLSSPKDSSLN
ncbi:MAG: biopolymer transporter [Cyanobacteria bacterium J083]|nr:MAG: biopolymer transporter [Cyanobacteria bacterium J083]